MKWLTTVAVALGSKQAVAKLLVLLAVVLLYAAAQLDPELKLRLCELFSSSPQLAPATDWVCNPLPQT